MTTEYQSPYMGAYVRTFLEPGELEALRATLIAAGIELRDVPANPWQLCAFEVGRRRGGIYVNKHGETSMPAEIFEYLEQDVRVPGRAYGFRRWKG